MRTLPLFVALLLTACEPFGISDMPNPRDDAALRRALLSLDPVAPGHVRTRDGNYGLGELGSDRELFAEYARNYISADEAREGNIDYTPIPLPGSIREAIEIQRKFRHDTAVQLAREARQEAAQRSVQAERDRMADVQTREKEVQRRRENEIADKIQAMADAQSAARNKAFEACEYQVSMETFKNSARDDGSVARAFDCNGKRDAARVEDQQQLRAFDTRSR